MWMSPGTHVNESCPANKSPHTCERVMSCEWVMSHMQLSHVLRMSHSTYVNESCPANESFHICEWGMSFELVISHILVLPDMNSFYHKCGWFTSHLWMSPVTHVNESRQHILPLQPKQRPPFICLFDPKPGEIHTHRHTRTRTDTRAHALTHTRAHTHAQQKEKKCKKESAGKPNLHWRFFVFERWSRVICALRPVVCSRHR